MFCPKCGGLLIPKKENNKTVLYCPKCGYKTTKVENPKIVEKIDKETKVEVVEKNADIEALPIADDVKCPKCGYDKVRYWLVQTRSADEAETRFFKCPKCGYSWREYD